MSSVVNKSGTRFAPKFAKRSKPKKIINDDKKLDAAAEGVLPTPPSTQIPIERPLFDDSIDPIDATKPLKSVFEASEDEINSDDDLKLPGKDVVKNRRLSGITAPNSILKRSGSISYQAASSISGIRTGDEGTASPAMGIPVPLNRPTRKRKTSTKLPQSKKAQPISFAQVTIKQTSPTPPPVNQAEEERLVKMDSEDATRLRIGIDPRTKKFRRFADDEVIPANVEFSTVISDLKNLSRNATEDVYSELVVGDGMTMSQLCKPYLPLGEVSDKFELVQEAAKKIKAKKLMKREQRLRARRENKSIEMFEEEIERKRVEEMERKKAQQDLMNAKEPQEVQQTSFKLKMTDGKLNIDEDSLVVDRHVRDGNSEFYEKIDENPYENPVNSGTYGKQKYTDRWTVEEDSKFYTALSTWGTDFAIIAQLFPYRNRRQVKLKFNSEERKHPYIIEMALRRKLPADFQQYLSESTLEIRSLDEYNKELRELKTNHEKALKTMQVEKEKAKQDDIESQNRREIEIRTGARSMTRAEKLKQLRANEVVVGTIDDTKKAKEPEAVST